MNSALKNGSLNELLSIALLYFLQVKLEEVETKSGEEDEVSCLTRSHVWHRNDQVSQFQLDLDLRP